MRSKKICLQREIQGFNLTKGATAPERTGEVHIMFVVRGARATTFREDRIVNRGTGSWTSARLRVGRLLAPPLPLRRPLLPYRLISL
jgi:hypothetical protein